MCGIAGALGPVVPDEGKIARTLGCMRHRGPDAHGWQRAELRGQPLTLLHSRLSIIDLDERSNQPFAVDGCTLVFNGEIYNYLELRHDLKRRGQVFETESDTEVVIKAYLEFGLEFVERMEGM